MHKEIMKRVRPGRNFASRTPWYDSYRKFLQAGSVDSLHVDGDLTTTILNDHDADATTSTLEGLLKTGPNMV